MGTKSGWLMGRNKSPKRGSALVGTLLVMVTLAGMMASSLSVAYRRVESQRGYSASNKAYQVAEAGLDRAIALANTGQFDAMVTAGQSQSLTQISILGAQADVSVFRLADVDDGAGTTTRTLRIESLGQHDQRSKKMVAFLRQLETEVNLTANLPTIQSAITMNDPFSDIKFSGNSFLISGMDKNINGSAPATPGNVYGLGVGPQGNGTPGSTSAIADQLTNNQKPKVQGIGATPSIGAVNAVPIDTVIAALAPYANVTLANQSGTYTGNLGDYNTGQAQLTFVDGDIHISGGSTGYGVLLVDGNLTISGNWNYVGLIFVNGQVTFSGGGNTKKLTGAIFLEGNVQDGNVPNQQNENPQEEEDLTINGNITVQYSGQAVGLVTNWLATLNSSNVTPYSMVASAESWDISNAGTGYDSSDYSGSQNANQ